MYAYRTDELGNPNHLSDFLNREAATKARLAKDAANFKALSDKERLNKLSQIRTQPNSDEFDIPPRDTDGKALLASNTEQTEQEKLDRQIALLAAILASRSNTGIAARHGAHSHARGSDFIEDLSGIRSVVELIAHAIGYVESRNRYDIIGPRCKDGDHAYGRYQVMGKYIPEWTLKVLGRSLTPEEFLRNPQAQDAVAHARMGAIYKQYGTVQDVASVWFSGRPLSHNNSHDVTGVSVPLYAHLTQDRFDRLSDAMHNNHLSVAANAGPQHPSPNGSARAQPHPQG